MAVTFTLIPGQHLTLTPKLRESIEFLQLSTVELTQAVASALDENPLLELAESEDSQNQSETSESFHWDSERDGEGEWDTPASTTLSDHLSEQAGVLPLSEKDRSLLSWLIGCLDNEGFLREGLEDVASSFPIASEEITEEDWRVALSLLQSFDPPGIGARDVKESLLIQLKHRIFEGKIPADLADAVEETIRDHLELVARHKYSELKAILKCSEDCLKDILSYLGSFTPHPASAYSSEKINFVIPEVSVSKIRGKWTVSLVSQNYSRIRLNDSYAQAVVLSEDSETRNLWKGRLAEARELVRNIEQRQKSLLKVAGALLRHQEQFFEKGPSALRPLILRQIAEETELHESTVSRICNGKYLICPSGVFELKYFFSSSVGSTGGQENASSAAVKNAIRKLIDEETKTKPLSDAKLAVALEKEGFSVARRTVAKYRESLGIPSASERKQLG